MKTAKNECETLNSFIMRNSTEKHIEEKQKGIGRVRLKDRLPPRGRLG